MFKRLFSSIFGSNESPSSTEQKRGESAEEELGSRLNYWQDSGRLSSKQNPEHSFNATRKRRKFQNKTQELLIISEPEDDAQVGFKRHRDSLLADEAHLSLQQDLIQTNQVSRNDREQDRGDEGDSQGQDGNLSIEQQSERSMEGSQSESSAISAYGQAKRIGRKRGVKANSKASKRESKALNRVRDDLSEPREENEVRTYLDNATSGIKELKQTLDQCFKNVELNCPICMDYIVSCRNAVCGHSFCEKCLHESLIHRKECPNCRQDVRKWALTSSDIIDSAVKMMVKSKTEGGDASEQARFEERVKAHEAWKKNNLLQSVEPGQTVDALDTEHIWCKAQVELKIQSKGRKPLLFIHYDGWSRKYDEYVYQDSHRLAPLGTFTHRVDIPRYQSNGQGRQPMNYAQVIDSARNMQLNQDQIGEVDINGQGGIFEPVEEDSNENNNNNNEASNDSQNAREEPEPERNQREQPPAPSDAHQQRVSAASRLQRGVGAASGNRDSNLGRPSDPAPNSASGQSLAWNTSRPSTRPSRQQPSWAFSIEPNQRSVLSTTNRFFQLNNTGQSSTNPYSTTRRQSPFGPAASSHAEGGTSNRFADRTRTIARQQQTRESSSGAQQQPPQQQTQRPFSRGPFTANILSLDSSNPAAAAQNNTGDAPAASNPPLYSGPNPFRYRGRGEGDHEFTESRPVFQFGQAAAGAATGSSVATRNSRPPLARRLSVPSNTGNVMRGASQSNTLGSSQRNAQGSNHSPFTFPASAAPESARQSSPQFGPRGGLNSPPSNPFDISHARQGANSSMRNPQPTASSASGPHRSFLESFRSTLAQAAAQSNVQNTNANLEGPQQQTGSSQANRVSSGAQQSREQPPPLALAPEQSLLVLPQSSSDAAPVRPIQGQTSQARNNGFRRQQPASQAQAPSTTQVEEESSPLNRSSNLAAFLANEVVQMQAQDEIAPVSSGAAANPVNNPEERGQAQQQDAQQENQPSQAPVAENDVNGASQIEAAASMSGARISPSREAAANEGSVNGEDGDATSNSQAVRNTNPESKRQNKE